MEIKLKGTAEQLYKKIKPRLELYCEEGKLRFQEVEFNDDMLQAQARGRGFKAKIQFHDGLVEVDLDLNLLLKPLRGTIEEGIRERLRKLIG